MSTGGSRAHAVQRIDPNRSIQFHHSYAKVNDDGYADSEHDHTVVGSSGPTTDRKKANLRHVHVACTFIMLMLVLAIVMWDMKKVQTMSTIIHDDHRSLWISMNSTVLKFWYNSYDLCVLNRGSITRSRSDNQRNGSSAMSIISPNSIIINNNSINRQCKSVISTSQDSSKQIPLRCNVGYGYHNLDCLSNLTMRSFYRYMLNDRALGDPRNMMLRTVLMDLSMTKRPIVILGDGVSKQSQDAMICEMLRTDKSVKVSSKSSFYSSNYTLRWPKERRQVDLFYFRLVTINADDEAPHRRRHRRSRRVLNHSIDDATAMNSSHEVAASNISTNDSSSSSSRWGVTSTTLLPSNDSQSNNDLSGNSSQSLVSDLSGNNSSQSSSDLSGNNSSQSVLIGSSDSVVDAVALRDVDEQLPVPSMDEGLWANSSIPAVVVDERPLFSTQLVDSDGAMNNSSSNSSTDFNTPTDAMKSNDSTTIVYSSISNISHATNATLSEGPQPSPDQRVVSIRFTFLQSRVRALLEQYRSLVVVVNVGVYYNSREQFRTDLPQLLDWMHSLHVEHNCTVFFRETAAQHWSHTSSGYFEMDIDGQNSSVSSCMPVADSTPGKQVMLRLSE